MIEANEPVFNISSLVIIYTEEECSNAINNMKSNKAPGLDGLTVEFYREFWGKVKLIINDSLNPKCFKVVKINVHSSESNAFLKSTKTIAPSTL
jgi:hypothetical protein